ncbi:hypothetical protein [Leifsonia sp. Leaf264]|uniref:hypothetical protein n=1 Tax=Leifsonia sp. Leaf264 TaxID=1736314 RepID=UPI0006FAB07D|nr:hypothetical protein [Leifsonia sp. Leaf264]KQO98594.1 hypothetical protein ASF30_11065 [Leifsonia sp. Leaf264]
MTITDPLAPITDLDELIKAADHDLGLTSARLTPEVLRTKTLLFSAVALLKEARTATVADVEPDKDWDWADAAGDDLRNFNDPDDAEDDR